MATGDVWCVGWRMDQSGPTRVGWCATATGRDFDEGMSQVKTRCDHYISLPLGCEKRVPTCDWCLKLLEKADGEG